MNTEALAIKAVRAALLLRTKHGAGMSEGVCPYDVAIKLEVKVSLISAPSLEGMYSPEPKPAIILNSERPAGRRRYTCAHEIGHHIFKHGYKVDELNASNSSAWSPEEYLAQRFASALLMPKIVVDAAFSRRGLILEKARAEHFFIVAQELGVGFTTLITNMEVNLKAISKEHAEELRRTPLPATREVLAGKNTPYDVFIVDKFWIRPTVDVEVGDLIALPSGIEIDNAYAKREPGISNHFLAAKPGQTGINMGPGSKPLTLRISKRGFTGLARYRHLEDDSDDT